MIGHQFFLVPRGLLRVASIPFRVKNLNQCKSTLNHYSSTSDRAYYKLMWRGYWLLSCSFDKYKYKVFQRLNLCFIYEKNGVKGYQIWRHPHHVSDHKYKNTPSLTKTKSFVRHESVLGVVSSILRTVSRPFGLTCLWLYLDTFKILPFQLNDSARHRRNISSFSIQPYFMKECNVVSV